MVSENWCPTDCPSFIDFQPPFLCPKHIQLFTPTSKFIPLVYGHQVLPLTKDDIFNVGMIKMQYELTDQWPRYPPDIHIRPTTTIKFMPDWIALRLPPLDLRKKKGKVPPHPSPKDYVALRPFPYSWNMNFTRDATKKTVSLKPNVEFNQNDIILFYFKDMYENSRFVSTLEYNKTPPIICAWCRCCIQPRFIDSMIGICASWGKRGITSSINASSMIFLLFTLGLSLTCTSTAKLLWEEQ